MTRSGFSDDYIIRIYRHSRRDLRRFVGTVEEVGREGKRAFATIDELWDILVRKEESRKKPEKQENKEQDTMYTLTATKQ